MRFFLSTLCAVFFLSSTALRADDSSELPLTERPAWAQWRSEGNGIVKFFAHFLDYQKKSELIAPWAFPGQLTFFTENSSALYAYQPKPTTAPMTLCFVGDLMHVDNANEHFVDEAILAKLHGCDLRLGNLETPLSQSSSLSGFRNSLSQYNTSPEYLKALEYKGEPVFDFLSIANNHAYDRGNLGIKETAGNLQDLGIKTHGVDDSPFTLIQKKDIRFGISTATWGFNDQIFGPKHRFPIPLLKGIAPMDEKHPLDLEPLFTALDKMKEAKVDFKILFLHWGYEYELYPEPRIQEVARHLVEHGADLVIGCHPHVVQPFELVTIGKRRALVAYSMGNFITNMDQPMTKVGLLQTLQVWKNTDQSMDWSWGESSWTESSGSPSTHVKLVTDPNNSAVGIYKKNLHLL